RARAAPRRDRDRAHALHPELIHAGEQHRVLALELLPPVEVGHGARVREASAIGDGGLSGEADEIQALRREERLYLRDRQLMLLHVEQEIAALAGGEEVGIFRDVPQRRALCKAQQLLPAPPDVCAPAIAVTGYESGGGRGAGAGERAVEPDMHESARPQQRKQHLPALRPVAHMMQDAAGLDQIEPACKRPDLEDIGLRILDVANAKRAGLAQREAEAGAAEVDGEYPRARKPLRGLDRVLAGAAT